MQTASTLNGSAAPADAQPLQAAPSSARLTNAPDAAPAARTLVAEVPALGLPAALQAGLAGPSNADLIAPGARPEGAKRKKAGEEEGAEDEDDAADEDDEEDGDEDEEDEDEDDDEDEEDDDEDEEDEDEEDDEFDDPDDDDDLDEDEDDDDFDDDK